MAASIFRDDRDRLRFLETLEENCEKTGWLVHAYGLMSDHYHPLMETPEANGDRMGRRRYEAYVESRALEVERRGRVAEDLEAEEELPRALEVLGWEEAAVLFGAQTGVGLVTAQADGGGDPS